MALAHTMLSLYRGDTFTQKLTIQNPGDPPTPIPLEATGWSAQIRASVDDPTVIATFAVNAAEAASGILYLTLTAEQSAVCTSGVWDLQHENAEGVVRTYLRGRFVVEADVTRD